LSLQSGGSGGSSILNIAIIGGVVVIAIIALTGLLKSASGIFGTGGDKGGQTSDSTSELARSQAEQSRAETEAGRLEEEADRAETEGRRADAEELRAQAEIVRAEAERLRAENDKLAIELADKAGTLSTNVQIGDESDDSQMEKTGAETANEVSEETGATGPDQTASGQTGATSEPDTSVKGTKPDVEVSVGRDEIEEAIEKAQSGKTRGQQRFKKSSFFSSGSGQQIIVETDPVTGATITGGGTTGKKQARFTIFETKPQTLSDVLRIHPEFTASQARNFLSSQGVFSTDPRVQEVQKKKFKAFDFGTNTGRGLSTSKTVVRGATTQEALKAEELRAQETLRKILVGEQITKTRVQKKRRTGRGRR